MKLIHSSVEIIEQKPGMQGIYEQIELAARNCYKSESLINYDEEGNSTTAKDFVDKIVNVYKHQSVAEHGTVYLRCKIIEEVDNHSLIVGVRNPLKHYSNDKYSKYKEVKIRKGWDSDDAFVTTNYRVLLENNWLDDLQYMCEPTEYHEKRVTVRVKCSIGISREWNRHRSLSASEQSTRYCDYSKGKFGRQLTFVIPSWTKGVKTYEGDGLPDSEYRAEREWINFLSDSEHTYLYLTNNWKLSPQEARSVLPLDTATEVIYTGFVSDWRHFFDLRCAENAHPDIRKLAVELKEQFIKKVIL